VRELEGLTNVSTPHRLEKGKPIVDPLWNRLADNPGFLRLHEAVAPAGAMHANVMDMASFLRMFLDEGAVEGRQFLNRETVRTMLSLHSAVPIKVAPNAAHPQLFYGGGLGWQLRDCRGRKIAMHSGSSGAIAALMPEEKIGVVVLANRSSGIEFMFMH